jgi:hypothetical protein
MSSKSRPITAKTIFYNSDGFGRDTYIQYNNGGLTAPNERKTNFDRGKLLTRLLSIHQGNKAAVFSH